jgi:Cu(I)/Ag(I) efflux system membrane fusion protein
MSTLFRPLRVFVSAFLCTVVLNACDGRPGARQVVEAQAAKAGPVPSAPTTPAQTLAVAYLNAQAKLAADDFAAAHMAFGSVRTAAAAPALVMTDEQRKKIVSAATDASAAPDLAKARSAFAGLSDAVLAWVSAKENPLKETLVVAYCPMARSGKGAKWLQLGEKIRNPYFGSEMLECGSVDAQLKPSAKP